MVFLALQPLHTTSYNTSTKTKHPSSCWHFNRCTLPPTSTKAKHPSSQTEKLCPETDFESYKALLVAVVSKLVELISRLTSLDIACRWKRVLVGTSTAAHYTTFSKAKHLSSQTEKMCFETEFESYKALLTVVVSFELASMRHYYFNVLSLGLGSNIRCLVLRGGFSNTTVGHPREVYSSSHWHSSSELIVELRHQLSLSSEKEKGGLAIRCPEEQTVTCYKKDVACHSRTPWSATLSEICFHPQLSTAIGGGGAGVTDSFNFKCTSLTSSVHLQYVVVG
eukprot:scaffold8755_cov69-Skeletonema_marinoi.AAC.1